ncbi:hypothetical protein TcasGA2_TC012746 [Tribolium castaneum]|uniref:Uncharacterized protein n=1 Tax=Tribolium castaneum TaxID=7070 RepID=D6WZZ0_TRICA|nr:hypothetical protein TcasGA2_TC012746 [Tribolium castaneum]
MNDTKHNTLHDCYIKKPGLDWPRPAAIEAAVRGAGPGGGAGEAAPAIRASRQWGVGRVERCSGPARDWTLAKRDRSAGA